jgi:FtsP/CotA-like multicopper oxidase with cupredoxin domain
MYWYHPHVREDMQQDLGLYGNLWVTPQNTNTYAAVNKEIPVFIDDLLLGKNGTPLSYGKAEADHALMGRFGNVMLVNGAINPILSEAKRGDVLRFFFTNAANTRTFKLAFKGAQMKLIGGDGGKIGTEKFVDSITLAPSERAIVDVLFETDGEITLKHIGPQVYTLASVFVKESSSSPSYVQKFPLLDTNAEMAAAADLVAEYSAKDPDETIHLSVTGHMMGGMMMDHGTAEDGIEWEDSMPMMNSMATKANTQWKIIDEASGKENMDIHYTFTKGEKIKIRIINDKDSSHPMQHPIHFHGQRFLVLSMNGVRNENLVWKDTVLVPKDATVDILLDVTNPGDWMIHCHIAEHLSNGMMGMFTVE